MKTVSIRFSDMDKKTLLYLGYVGENLHRRILIDCKKEFEEMPGAIPALVVTAPNGLKYPVDVTVEGNTVIWDITNSDLIHEGNGEIQLALTKDEEVGKSAVCRTKVDKSIEPDGEAPDPIENWLIRAEKLLEEIPEEIADAIEEAKESGLFDGVGISSIGYVRTVGQVNIYRINLTDGSFYDFEVSNGEDGQPGTNGVGIVSITKTGTVGLVDTYTITLTNGQTYHFTVTNGQNGAEIDDTTPALNKVFSSSKMNGELTQLKSDIQALGQITKNLFDDNAFKSASGISLGQDGFYYGTVSAWVAAFNSLLPMAETFAASTRYTFSCKYYFSDVGAYTGNSAALKLEYSDESSGTIFNFNASKTTSTGLSTTTEEKTVDHCMFALLDGRASSYVLHIKDLQVEAGTVVTDYVPHFTADDKTAKNQLAEVRNNIVATNDRIDNIAKNNSEYIWELGAISSSGKWISYANQIRMTKTAKLLKGAIISCDSGYQFRAYQYSEYLDKNAGISDYAETVYQGSSGWQTKPYTITTDAYYCICFETTSETASVGIESHLHIKENAGANELAESIEYNTNAINGIEKNEIDLSWEVGYYNTSTGAKQNALVCVRTTKMVYLHKGAKVYMDTGYMSRLYRYNKNDLQSFAQYYGYDYDRSKHYITGEFEIPADGYYNVVVSDYAQQTTVTDAAAIGAHIHIQPMVSLDELKHDVSLDILPYNLEGLKAYINSVLGMNGDVVVHIVTDIHGGFPDTYSVINYLANAGIGDCFFEMGDVIKSTFNTRDLSVSYLRESFKTMGNTRTNTPIVFLQGNHDTNPLSGIQTSKNVTQEIFYGLSMARAKNLKQQTNKAYGYVDIDHAKVRLIYLNTSDIFNKTTGDALVAGQYTMIQQDQVDWFIGTALNFSDKATPTDWSVIIFTHDSLSQISSGLFSKILTAFQNGTADTGSYNITVDSYTYTLTCNCDFTSQGALTVICEVNGHHHKDMIRELGTTGIKQVYVACEGPASACYDDNGDTVYYDRVRGTTDEHLIDTLVLDKANSKVYFKRFGVGTDREISY